MSAPRICKFCGGQVERDTTPAWWIHTDTQVERCAGDVFVAAPRARTWTERIDGLIDAIYEGPPFDDVGVLDSARAIRALSYRQARSRVVAQRVGFAVGGVIAALVVRIPSEIALPQDTTTLAAIWTVLVPNLVEIPIAWLIASYVPFRLTQWYVERRLERQHEKAGYPMPWQFRLGQTMLEPADLTARADARPRSRRGRRRAASR